MALSNSQYNAIMRTYQRQQLKNKHELDQRQEIAYEKIPVLRELDARIGSMALSSAKQLLNGDAEALKDLREEIEDIKEQRQILLQAYGFSQGFMQMQYACNDCQDTAYQDGKPCHCFLQEKRRLLYAQSNVQDILKRENFGNFSFDYYDNTTIHPALKKTVASYMEQIVRVCKSYVETFPKERKSILFTGSTGVGKTFLSNCIAKELVERYYSVIYLSANDLFDVFSRNKFDYDTKDEMKDMYEQVLNCDLLIIDDLGTEMDNTFTASQLFYCINERLVQARATIISTNLSLNMLRDTYTDRVTSRIMSHYQILPLYGSDIRLEKR